jgi:hypothetical protein
MVRIAGMIAGSCDEGCVCGLTLILRRCYKTFTRHLQPSHAVESATQVAPSGQVVVSPFVRRLVAQTNREKTTRLRRIICAES